MEVNCAGENLVPVSAMPKPFQGIFHYRYFNCVQSESFCEAYLTDNNLIVSAPTGSGKTGIFELCILRLLTKCLAPIDNFIHPRGAMKTVYIAPTKALIQEKLKLWEDRFGPKTLGLICQQVTGDSDFVHVKNLQDTDIILTTPEKFDSTTRRCRDHGGAGFIGDVALLLIDEVHLLNDSRGAALEAIVSRMKMLARCPELKDCSISRMRFAAVSATIPNIDDLAEWLHVPPQAMKRFGEEMRPVKLLSKVYGYSAARNDFLFEKRLQYFLYDLIVQNSAGKPTLVFCPTRKGAQDTALKLAEHVSKPNFRNPFIKNEEHRLRLQSAATSTNDKNLQLYIPSGVAFHNGGVGFADRALVEELFLRGDLQVLCTTMTLAHGMNLPAHLVIIKSTQYYCKEQGRYLEYERSTLLQMCGRAGRPQFDDSGVVVIMTKNETKHLYQNMLSGSDPVESQLLASIAEHLNAETVLMTVTDVGLALEWLKCSFLHVRLRKNPKHYGVKTSLPEEQIDKYLKEICLKAIRDLADYGLVEMDQYGFTLKHLEPGRLMAKYYMSFETMKTITKIPERSSMETLLHAVTEAQEFSWIQLRRYEKKQLNSINQETSPRIKFHILGQNGKFKKRLQTSAEKIFVLLNDALSGEPSTLDFTMTQDVAAICMHGARITHCMSDYFKFLKRYSETMSALLLTKCLRRKLWDDSAYMLKQLPGVGMVTAKAFISAGISNFDTLAASDPRTLEQVTGRKFPFGDQIKSSLNSLPPKVELKVQDTHLHIGGKSETIVELIRVDSSNTLTTTSKWHRADMIIGDETQNQLLFYESLRLDEFSSPYTIPVYSTNKICAALISEQFVGVDAFYRTPKEKIYGLGPPDLQAASRKRKRKLPDGDAASLNSVSGGGDQTQSPSGTQKEPQLQLLGQDLKSLHSFLQDPDAAQSINFSRQSEQSSETASSSLTHATRMSYPDFMHPHNQSQQMYAPEKPLTHKQRFTQMQGYQTDTDGFLHLLQNPTFIEDHRSVEGADSEIIFTAQLPQRNGEVYRNEKAHAGILPSSSTSSTSNLTSQLFPNSEEVHVANVIRSNAFPSASNISLSSDGQHNGHKGSTFTPPNFALGLPVCAVPKNNDFTELRNDAAQDNSSPYRDSSVHIWQPAAGEKHAFELIEPKDDFLTDESFFSFLYES